KSMLPADNPLMALAGIDSQVLAFLAALALLTGLAFGLAPAISASKLNLAEAFKARGQQAAGIRLRSFLIVGEIALAVVLVVSGGLLKKVLGRWHRVVPGFTPEQIVTARVSPQPPQQQQMAEERAATIALYDEVLRRARSQPGVTEVAAANTAPLN